MSVAIEVTQHRGIKHLQRRRCQRLGVELAGTVIPKDAIEAPEDDFGGAIAIQVV